MRYTHELDANGRPEWLRIVHAVNALEPGTFGKPTQSGPWWAGGEHEEYPAARVVFRTDGSVSIVAKTEPIEAALRQAHLTVTGQSWPR